MTDKAISPLRRRLIRGHDDPPAQPQDALPVYPPRQKVCRFPGPLPTRPPPRMSIATADARPLSRPAVEVADIFRHRGPAWRASYAGHVSLGQLKVMSAIERCRTVALGGHVERCEDCAHLRICYNSC